MGAHEGMCRERIEMEGLHRETLCVCRAYCWITLKENPSVQLGKRVEPIEK